MIIYITDADVSILKKGDQFHTLYFSTPDMRSSLASWPEIVLIDGTYGSLDSNLTVMLIIVEDSNAASEIVAIGLLAVEDEPTVTWFLSTLKLNNGDVWKRISCFMSDKDHVGRKALKTLFYDPEKKSSPTVYICLFHALNAFRKPTNVFTRSEKDLIRGFLSRLAYSQSEGIYAEMYGQFCKSVPQEIVKYYNDRWHSIKEEWMVHSMTEGNLMNRTINRVESINQKLKQVIAKRSTLTEFIRGLFIYADSHADAIDATTSDMFMKWRMNLPKGSAEQKYSEWLTDAAFDHVSNEIERHERARH